MQRVLAAAAEAIWPALSVPPGGVASFWRSSGADVEALPAEVLRIVDTSLYGANQHQLRLLLVLMSHRLPMLLLAGRHCLSASWPFVLSFPELSVAARQRLLLSWARSRLSLLRKSYKALKALVASVLLSHVDPGTGTSPLFEGMGYTPGSKQSAASAGPPPPGADEAEELLASATVHLPAAAASGNVDLHAYLTKRGYHTGSDNSSSATHANGNGSTQQQRQQPLELFYDAVIVGSGAGGGVTAALLAGAGMQVLVLEKAGWVRRKDMSWQEAQAHREMYERGGFMVTDDGNITLLAGSTLGGGTKINWTASLRTPPHVRAEWAAAPHGLAACAPGARSYDDALDAVCSRLGVRTGTAMSGPNARLLQGLHALGLHGEELPRNCLSPSCHAYCNLGCRSGHKQSSDVTWLVDAVRAGAHVLTGVEGQVVLTMPHQDPAGLRRRKVSGLLARTAGRSDGTPPEQQPLQLLVHAPLVVASCGSIHTPALLLRSGIRVNGNVGRHLWLHPAAGAVAQYAQTPQQAAAGQGAVDMHKGVSMGCFSRAAAAWGESGYGALVSVPAAHPGLLAAITPDVPAPGTMKALMALLPDIGTVVVITRDSSSGRVRIDAQGRPVVSYRPCSETREHLLDGLVVALRAFVAAGAVRVLVPNCAEAWDLTLEPGASQQQREEQLEALVRRMRAAGVRDYDMPLFSAHQMGSCRLGSSPRTSVCDSRGECWEVAGLHVADGSLLPTPSGVNPMISIYALSYMVGDAIASRWKQDRKLRC